MATHRRGRRIRDAAYDAARPRTSRGPDRHGPVRRGIGRRRSRRSDARLRGAGRRRPGARPCSARRLERPAGARGGRHGRPQRLAGLVRRGSRAPRGGRRRQADPPRPVDEPHVPAVHRRGRGPAGRLPVRAREGARAGALGRGAGRRLGARRDRQPPTVALAAGRRAATRASTRRAARARSPTSTCPPTRPPPPARCRRPARCATCACARARASWTQPPTRRRSARLITDSIGWQERMGLDVLVHGEFERTDMVEYFAEQMDGYLTTRNGWVLSYGSRCTRAADPGRAAHHPRADDRRRVAPRAGRHRASR